MKAARQHHLALATRDGFCQLAVSAPERVIALIAFTAHNPGTGVTGCGSAGFQLTVQLKEYARANVEALFFPVLAVNRAGLNTGALLMIAMAFPAK